MIKAILYDVDGLMVDSESLGINVAVEIMRKHGFDLSGQEKQKFIGVTDEKFYRDLFVSRRINLDVRKVLEEHFVLYENKLPGVKVFPGVIESVRRFSKNYVLAVVSGSTAKQVDIILKSLGVDKFFKLRITCEHYKKSKPDPEPYLLASEKLGIKPEDCFVLEDAPSGIKSAKDAGMHVVGVKIGNEGRLDLSEANKIINTLDEISLDLIKLF